MNDYKKCDNFVFLSGKQKIADIVRKIRKGESVRDFAKRLGLSHTTINNLENCKGKAELKTLKAIAPFTSFSVDELVAIIENRKSEIREILVAEEILPLILKMPAEEQIKIINETFQYLAQSSAIGKEIIMDLMNKL